jgi:pimeloyl-ACP methyl ester carboxylesterase
VEAGSTKPVIILVAGAGEIVLDWAVLLPELAGQFRVVAYDRAGLGASDRVRRLTVQSQVDDLVALLDAVGSAVLVGHSWGGLLAELAACARPRHVLGLVLVDPFHEDIQGVVPWTLRAVSTVMLNGIMVLKAVGLFHRIAAKMGRALAERCTTDSRTRALIADAYLASYANIGNVAMIRAENRLGDVHTDQVRAARAASIRPDVPMWILTATRGKPPAQQQRTHDLAEQTAAYFPRGEHRVIPDTGHYIHKDQPVAVVEAIVSVVTQTRDSEKG